MTLHQNEQAPIDGILKCMHLLLLLINQFRNSDINSIAVVYNSQPNDSIHISVSHIESI